MTNPRFAITVIAVNAAVLAISVMVIKSAAPPPPKPVPAVFHAAPGSVAWDAQLLRDTQQAVAIGWSCRDKGIPLEQAHQLAAMVARHQTNEVQAWFAAHGIK